jgi:hypothetical protein
MCPGAFAEHRGEHLKGVDAPRVLLHPRLSICPAISADTLAVSWWPTVAIAVDESLIEQSGLAFGKRAQELRRELLVGCCGADELPNSCADVPVQFGACILVLVFRDRGLCVPRIPSMALTSRVALPGIRS